MAAKGFEVKELDEKPDIPGLEWVWMGFWNLSTERQMGMGMGPIPWSAISAYVEWHHIEGEDEYEFRYLINKLDDQFLKFHEPKDKPSGHHKR